MYNMSLCSSLQLNCFNGRRFLLFLVSTVIVPYITYHIVAKACKWTRIRPKSLGEHYETVLTALSSMSILWFLGNYEETFDITTFLFSVVGILIFGFVLENMKSTHVHTLVTKDCWDTSMHNVVIATLVIMSVFAVHHVHLAGEVSAQFQKNYVMAAVIPIILATIARKLVDVDNVVLKGSSVAKRMLFHLHHVHLFYTIAFYTRFPEFWSQMAAGLAVGASLHGAAAFGYDRSIYTRKATSEVL